MLTPIHFAAVTCLVLAHASLLQSVEDSESPIVVVATPSRDEVPEASPVVVAVTIENRSASNVDAKLDMDDLLALQEASSLVVTSPDGRVRRINYTGKPQANTYSLPVRRSIAAGTCVEFDRVFGLLSWGRHESTQEYGYQFIPPGEYSAEVVLVYGPGRTVSSQPFTLRVTSGSAEDVAARQHVTVDLAAFLCGGEPPGDADDLKRSALRRMVDDHPGSAYAEWIQFWRLYYHGAADEALQYARDHREFPLSDNLMLRVAEGLFTEKAYDRAREVSAELVRDFPDGDARHQALELQNRLSKKP